jgi:flagella basal body P-ring formation protein FlgA
MKILNNILGIILVGAVHVARADEGVVWQLRPEAKVDSSGIFLNQLVVPIESSNVAASSSAVATSSVILPQIRLAPAPSLGQTASLSRSEIAELAQKQVPGLITSNWSGAMEIRVTRRVRQFSDTEITELLTATLQRDYVKDRGELELNLSNPWTPVAVPDEPLRLKVEQLPATGVGANFIVRCELLNGKQRVGQWQLQVEAKIWREVPVARSPLVRGQSLRDADVGLERRDVLAQRDTISNFSKVDDSLEIAENISAGMPVLNRSVRMRPVIRRGKLVEGIFQEGALSISLKVETLEDGLLGQTVRVRNPKTKRELYGKVQNEQTVLIAL